MPDGADHTRQDCIAAIAGDRAALFLDFDGTLVELADTPDGIEIPTDLSSLLSRLHAALGGALVLVSGRRLSDLEEFLPRFAGDLSGSHGGEFRLGGRRHAHPETGSDAFAALLAKGRDFAARENLLFEEKPAGFVIHYRQSPDREQAVLDYAADLVRDTGFEVHRAKLGAEIKPEGVSKAGAVARFMEAFDGRIPVAIGDDATDEDMFAEAARHGGGGIKVGEGRTKARARLPDVAAVHAALQSHLEFLEKTR